MHLQALRAVSSSCAAVLAHGAARRRRFLPVEVRVTRASPSSLRPLSLWCPFLSAPLLILFLSLAVFLVWVGRG